jgi:UDP-glucose 4-epimerase
MARCLVTGHKGYIGSRLYAKLEELGHEVQGIDLQSEVPHDILKVLREDDDGKFHPHYYNFKPEYVFHMACFPRVPLSINQPVMTMENNVMAGSIILNFARKVGAKRLIYSSSSSIDGNGNGPLSPYGLQKYVTEWECKLYSDLYGLDTVALRYFNVYSPCQEATGAYSTVVANWMAALRTGITPFITGDGSQCRDMLWLEDAVDANIFCMDRTWDFHGQYYDCGTGENITLNSLKDLVNEYHPNIEFDYIKARQGDVMYTKAHTEPLEEAGWKSKKNIREGISECFKNINKT